MTMVEVARSSVQTWECDTMGHMNVQFYVAQASQALAHFGHILGLGPSELATQGLRLEVRDHHIRFLREQHAGAPFFLVAGVLDISPQSIRLLVEMRHTLTQVVAATFVGDAVLATASTRQHVDFPASVLKAAEAYRIELPAHAAPRGLTLYPARTSPLFGEAEAMGMMETWRGEVQPSQLDRHGRLAARRFMGIVSDSIPNLLAQTRGEDRSADKTVGGAALEYRFVYRDFPQAGALLALRSGLKEVTPKTYTWAHWLFDMESGDAVATAEAVAIALDLTTRKIIPIPDDMRADLEAKLIPGLGV